MSTILWIAIDAASERLNILAILTIFVIENSNIVINLLLLKRVSKKIKRKKLFIVSIFYKVNAL